VNDNLTGHGIIKCSCGVVIAQCRCIDNHKNIEVKEKACTECRLPLVGPRKKLNHRNADNEDCTHWLD
jgi:hypothetical protein